jgi:hypothetical protein
MKKLLLSFMLLISLSVFSQTKNPFVIQHCKDKMSEKEYYFAEKKLICSNAEKTKGFTITPSFITNDGKLVNNGFNCKNVNIGACDEKDELIFLFEDDTKITMTSWNKFNCDGNAYFDFSEDQLNQLSSKKVSAIRFTNGRTFDNLTYSLKETEKDYFVRAYTNFKIVEIDCSK